MATTVIDNCFDELEFWDTGYLCQPTITVDKIVIPVNDIRVYEEHPLNNTGKPMILHNGKLVFSKVSKSERIVYEYVVDTEGKATKHKQEKKFVDGPFAAVKDPVKTFVVEGVMKSPYVLINWQIECASFCLKVE